MVSIRAKGMRRGRAMKAIEESLGIELQTPRTRDNDLRHIMELEQVANAVMDVTAQSSHRLDAALELLESGSWTKAEMEAVLHGDTDSDTTE